MEFSYGRGINISMFVSNVEKMYLDLKVKNFFFFLELENHKYRVDDVKYEGMEFLIQDPDGYLLRFNN